MKSVLVISLLLMQVFSFVAAGSPNLTAVFDPEKMVIKLKWQNNDPGVRAFVLQRSADNYNWTNLYTIEAEAFSKNKMEKYTDQHPDPTKNYYRLKIITGKNNIEFSTAIMVILGQATNSWIMFPVPVSTVLHLQYTGSDPIQSVISVFIQNSFGKILTRFRSSSLNRTIDVPVSNLGKGIYDVRIVIGERVVWNQRFVK